MILTKKAIYENIENGHIKITPFNKSQMNPNSYNLKLHNELLIYSSYPLDMKKENMTRTLMIPKNGLMLQAGHLYLGRTLEYTEHHKHDIVPMIEGRSSVGRLGLSVHITAGFGDLGFIGYWTLELVPTIDIIVYPEIEICQIYYLQASNVDDPYESKKYQRNTGIQASKLYQELDTK